MQAVIGVILIVIALGLAFFSPDKAPPTRNPARKSSFTDEPGGSPEKGPATSSTNRPGGTNAAGTNPVGTNSTPLPNSADSQARADYAVKNGLLYNRSQNLCARGANNILSYYVNGEGMANSGANANDMGPVLQSRYGMSAVNDSGQYQNGDVHILTNSGYGHMEVYMNGRWYSDFAQNGSSIGSSRYNGSTLYRLP